VTANESMIEFWNGPGADRWVGQQDRYDAMLDPLSLPLVEQLANHPTESVLDVGCGCGSLSLSIARSRSAGATVTGVDISDPMLELARRRADEAGIGHAKFVHADAQTHAFEPGSVDLIVSRFGVMFFDDPVVAFANLGDALRPGGRLRCIVWQPRPANEWVAVPMSIASRFVELPPPADGPGPFAFGDPDTFRRTLDEAGWTVDAIDPMHGHLAVGGPSTFEEAVDFAIDQGPMAGMLADTDPDVVAQVRDAFVDELAPLYDGSELRLGCATWLVDATRP
jgi:SAM-dependent methyltransferase